MRGEDRNWKGLTAKRCPPPLCPIRESKLSDKIVLSPLPSFSFLLPPLFPTGGNTITHERRTFPDPFSPMKPFPGHADWPATLCYRVSLSPSPIVCRCFFPTTLENEPLPSFSFPFKGISPSDRKTIRRNIFFFLPYTTINTSSNMLRHLEETRTWRTTDPF